LTVQYPTIGDKGLGWGFMLVSAATIALEKNRFSAGVHDLRVGRVNSAAVSVPVARGAAQASLLRVPPFPGARLHSFNERPAASSDPAALASALRQLRIGGSYWGAQPALPENYALIRCSAAAEAAKGAFNECTGETANLPVIEDDCDPWHVLSGATALVAAPNDHDVCLIAALLGVPCYRVDADTGDLVPINVDAERLIAESIGGRSFENPFTGEIMNALEAVELCGFWRRLIDSNRVIDGGMGFAFWKQSHVAPLLWSGSSQFQFLRNAEGVKDGGSVAVWRAKAADGTIADLQRRNIQLVEVEDGFLRSRGLGADCVPPLSITVDRLGAHFDPSQPSELERLLQEERFDEGTVDRARDLRRVIVEAGIGKYEAGACTLDRRAVERRHLLVPGQVEDDRAVVTGGCGLASNLELLKQVREQAPNAYILYKPHPDVLAGHRRGAIADRQCLEFADEIVGELPIASLIDLVDEVHVNTSLAGFEALVREKAVTTYGVPFYSGWGLTRDLAPVPARRTAKRSIDELVAATLLIYPRYLDPVTGLPCPAEVVVARLSVSEAPEKNLIVGMRRLQGKFMRRLRSLVQ
jgi:capsular polysaccharide export protein